MSNGDEVRLQGVTNRAIPGAVTDNSYGPVRISRRGELMTAEFGGKWRYQLSDEGSYFYAHNNTIDVATTLAGHAAPVLVDADATMTKPLLQFRHSGASTSQVRAYLDFIEIEVMTAGANGTSAHWTAQTDTGTDRYSSGTVETFTSYNANMQSSAAPVLVGKGGPFVASVETSSARRLGHGTFKNAIELAGDKYVFNFGGDPAAANKVASAATVFPVAMPPVVLGPTDAFYLALWQVAQDAAGVYKVRFGWWER